MSIINKPNEFTGLAKAVATEVNDNFDTIYNEFNGSIDENNINLTKTEFKAALLETLKTVDGAGSGLDADLLEGKQYSEISTEILDTAEASANSYTDTQISENVPQGLISMWSGSITSIPSTWTLCDGTDGAPDLRDRFIIGAGGSYSVDSTGGASSVTLSSSQIPSHNHGDGTLSTNSTGGHNHSFSDTSDSDGYHSHSGTTNTAGSHEHNTVHSDADDSTSKIPHRVLYTHSDGAHSHSLNINGAGGHTHYVSGTTSSNGNHSHTISGDTGSTGGGNSHENRPPFYALAYIMKL